MRTEHTCNLQMNAYGLFLCPDEGHRWTAKAPMIISPTAPPAAPCYCSAPVNVRRRFLTDCLFQRQASAIVFTTQPPPPSRHPAWDQFKDPPNPPGNSSSQFSQRRSPPEAPRSPTAAPAARPNLLSQTLLVPRQDRSPRGPPSCAPVVERKGFWRFLFAVDSGFSVNSRSWS